MTNLSNMTGEELLKAYEYAAISAQFENPAMRANMIEYRAELLRRLALAERLMPIVSNILSIKDLYCDHSPGDPCQICALEEALKP